jgi:hypothetical protein
MSLEILISKYIDGELTREEDNYLRNLLKENPSAKHKFDSSVELHLEMLDDADDIKVPVDLLRRTEDRIMMEIFKSAPVTPVYNIKKVKRFNLSYNNVAAAIIVFFFLGVLSIRDSAFMNTGSFSDDSIKDAPKSEVINVAVSKPKIKDFKLNKSNLNKSKIIDLNSSEAIVTNSVQQQTNISIYSDAGPVDSKKSNLNESSASEANKESEIIKDKALTDSEPFIKDKSFDNFSNKKLQSNPVVNYNSAGNIPMNYMDGFPIEIREIHLTSFVSHDFFRNNIQTHENSAIMNYSQGISYAVNESSRIGMEFGLTQFSYDVNKMVTVSNITPSDKKRVEVLDPTDNNGTTLIIPVKIEQQEQLYWGSIFYEHTLFNFADFSLIGRAGLGASSDGALGYGLILANYSVYRGIYLSVGTEGRVFNSQIPSLGINNVTSSISIVYGLHFQF